MSQISTSLLLVAALVATIPAPAAAQPQDPVVQLLEALTNAPGPSGFEGPVRDIVTIGLHELGAEISHDGLGSVIGRFDGPPGSPRVMVTAHMDEVGLLVQYIRPDGFIKFKTLGGLARPGADRPALGHQHGRRAGARRQRYPHHPRHAR